MTGIPWESIYAPFPFCLVQLQSSGYSLVLQRLSAHDLFCSAFISNPSYFDLEGLGTFLIMTLLPTLLPCPVSAPLVVCELVNTTHQHHQGVEARRRVQPGPRGIKFAVMAEQPSPRPLFPSNLSITTQGVVDSAGSHHSKSAAILKQGGLEKPPSRLPEVRLLSILPRSCPNLTTAEANTNPTPNQPSSPHSPHNPTPQPKRPQHPYRPSNQPHPHPYLSKNANQNTQKENTERQPKCAT